MSEREEKKSGEVVLPEFLSWSSLYAHLPIVPRTQASVKTRRLLAEVHLASPRGLQCVCYLVCQYFRKASQVDSFKSDYKLGVVTHIPVQALRRGVLQFELRLEFILKPYI